MIKDDEYLERIVAGIQAVTTESADVQWNEIINGRQFDVTVRFKLGTLRYLVVVEVKNRSRKASVADIDALVTKASDNRANKAVFVNTAGYQEGAHKVAKSHGIDLFVVEFDHKNLSLSPDGTYVALSGSNMRFIKPEISIGESMELVNNVASLTLVYTNGKAFMLPDEPSQMNYYCLKTIMDNGQSLLDVIEGAGLPPLERDIKYQKKISFNPSVHIEPPDTYHFPSGDISEIILDVVGVEAFPISGPFRIEPTALSSAVVYKNAVTNESVTFPLYSLPLGADRVKPGAFYFTLQPLSYFYCEKISGKTVDWWMVESFQNGELIHTHFQQEVSYSRHYIRVADKKVINRLQARLDKVQRSSAAKQH